MTSLVFCPEGTKGKILDIICDKTLAKRLCEMGLNKGQEVEVIKNDAWPVIVGLNGSRIAVGRVMALKIYVN